jgi:hypothetical protein
MDNSFLRAPCPAESHPLVICSTINKDELKFML